MYFKMKTKEEMMSYQAPKVEIIEISVEHGFAGSLPNGIEDMPEHEI